MLIHFDGGVGGGGGGSPVGPLIGKSRTTLNLNVPFYSDLKFLLSCSIEYH